MLETKVIIVKMMMWHISIVHLVLMWMHAAAEGMAFVYILYTIAQISVIFGLWDTHNKINSCHAKAVYRWSDMQIS